MRVLLTIQYLGTRNFERSNAETTFTERWRLVLTDEGAQSILDQTVTTMPTTVVVASSLNPSILGQNVTITALIAERNLDRITVERVDTAKEALDRYVGDLGRCDLAGTAPVQGGGHRALHQRGPQLLGGRDQSRVGEHEVGARGGAAGVLHAGHPRCSDHGG